MSLYKDFGWGGGSWSWGDSSLGVAGIFQRIFHSPPDSLSHCQLTIRTVMAHQGQVKVQATPSPASPPFGKNLAPLGKATSIPTQPFLPS